MDKLLQILEKYAQHTKLDKALTPSSHSERHTWNQAQLPFGDRDDRTLQEQIRSDFEKRKKKQLEPKEPAALNFPELSPEQLKYRELNERELNRLREERNSEYEYQQRSYWRKDQPFQFSGERYFELNKMLPEEAKKKVLDKYNKLRVVGAEFLNAYKEANLAASEEVNLDYGASYIELFKNFPKFLIATIKKTLGQLFGLVPEKGGRHSQAFGDRARHLADFLTKFNPFNITPLNIETKLYEMTVAIEAMQEILKEYHKRNKLLKKLPELVNESSKRFLLKREHRKFLKWLDQYFSNDKEEFVHDSVRQMMDTWYHSKSTDMFRIGDLKKIKTYSSIYFSAQQKATYNLYRSVKNKVSYTIEERLKEELQSRVQPKIAALKEVVDATSPENIDPLIKYIFKNYKLDLKSIFNFVKITFERKYTDSHGSELGKEDAEREYDSFILNFLQDIKSDLKDLSSGWKFQGLLTDSVRYFIRKYHHQKRELDFEKLEKLDERDLNELVSQAIKTEIIDKIPNFRSRGGWRAEYSYPDFDGIGKLVKETGRFSIDAIVNFMHSKVPFVPKDFILNLVRTFFKDPKSLHTSPNKAFEQIYNLTGTNPQLAMNVLMDLLKKTGKLNPNSFTNVFLKSFDDISYMVSRIGAQLRSRDKDKLSDDQTRTVFSTILRNPETIERDKDNFDQFLVFIHNSAGNISAKDLIKMVQNKNFVSYSKVGISKRILNSYAVIKNLGGTKGIATKYGNVLKEMKDSGFISKNFERNVNLVVRAINSGEAINPASEDFKKLFEATSAIETDLQTFEMRDALKDLLTDYKEKDKRLFDLDFQINDKLRFRVLRDKDPRMLRVGIESNCCQRLGGVGEVAARYSFINPLAGVLILEWKNKQGDWAMLGQSYFHYVPKDNGVILDNVETNNDNVRDSDVDLGAAYAYLAQHAKSKLNLKYFLAGKSYSKIRTDKFKSHKMRGGDPRYFDRRALTSDNRSFYTDFAPSNSIDLLAPKFNLDKEVPKLTGRPDVVSEAFNVILPTIVKTAMVA